VQDTGEFVFNMCTWDLRHEMIATAEHAPSSVDEMAKAGLEAAECRNVRPPRVKASPVALECKHLQTIDLPPGRNSQSHMVIGEVVGIHIDDDVITDGIVDVHKMNLIARLGYLDYAKIESENIIALKRPDNVQHPSDKD
jgi:flavin reductase (DIM6/NTAB) family NADH-FMN oxidoreductase RutF